MSEQLKLGETIVHNGIKARVVRIVTRSLALHVRDDGTEYILAESYAQLKPEDDSVDFQIFSSEVLPYDGPQSHITALEHIPWRADK